MSGSSSQLIELSPIQLTNLEYPHDVLAGSPEDSLRSGNTQTVHQVTCQPEGNLLRNVEQLSLEQEISLVQLRPSNTFQGEG